MSSNQNQKQKQITKKETINSGTSTNNSNIINKKNLLLLF